MKLADAEKKAWAEFDVTQMTANDNLAPSNYGAEARQDVQVTESKLAQDLLSKKRSDVRK